MAFRLIFSILIAILLMNGCSGRFFRVGYEKGYCEEHGYDYSDAGVCGDPMTIYKYRKYIPTGCRGNN